MNLGVQKGDMGGWGDPGAQREPKTRGRPQDDREDSHVWGGFRHLRGGLRGLAGGRG